VPRRCANTRGLAGTYSGGPSVTDCRSDAVGLDAELRLCLDELAASNSDTTFVRVGSSWTRFGEFASHSGIETLGDVDPILAAAFVRARTSAAAHEVLGYADAVSRIRRASQKLSRNANERLLLEDLLMSLPHLS